MSSWSAHGPDFTHGFGPSAFPFTNFFSGADAAWTSIPSASTHESATAPTTIESCGSSSSSGATAVTTVSLHLCINTLFLTIHRVIRRHQHLVRHVPLRFPASQVPLYAILATYLLVLSRERLSEGRYSWFISYSPHFGCAGDA